MLALRLVNAIEQHAEQLTEAVVHALRTDPRTPSYRRLESQEDHVRVFAVVHNLGKWLDTKSDKDTKNTYPQPRAEALLGGHPPVRKWSGALMLTKQIICHFIESEGWTD